MAPPLALGVSPLRPSAVSDDHPGPAAARHCPAAADLLKLRLHRPRGCLDTAVPFWPPPAVDVDSLAASKPVPEPSLWPPLFSLSLPCDCLSIALCVDTHDSGLSSLYVYLLTVGLVQLVDWLVLVLLINITNQVRLKDQSICCHVFQLGTTSK